LLHDCVGKWKWGESGGREFARCLLKAAQGKVGSGEYLAQLMVAAWRGLSLGRVGVKKV
jgi:hypothetical protein